MSYAGGRGRVAAICVAVATCLALGLASEAWAGAKYSVAQCGWHLDADADWADTTGGAKFRPDRYCATPAGADPFDGAHLKSFTKPGAGTVSGTRFARWRWTAPPGTGITQLRATWWHALHDGIEQRIGAVPLEGGFDVFAAAGSTDVAPREFVAGFSKGIQALEDRLLCARAETKFCSLDPESWSGLRALTITIEDWFPPGGWIGGELTAPGWRRGDQQLQFSDGDNNSGIRFGETILDGARVNLTEFPCAKAMIGGEWRATLMRPCEFAAAGSTTVSTTRFSDGPHALGHCATDFAGNVACLPNRTILIDNNPPAHPRGLAVAGPEGWRRTNDFDLAWENPDQGPASPIAGAVWRVTGPGYDSAGHFAAGRGLAVLSDLAVPRAGAFAAALYLRDEAGNEAPGSAVSVPLRFDDVPPSVAFNPESSTDSVGVVLADEHSGPASGEIAARRIGSEEWSELPSKFQADGEGRATLVARTDSLAPGVYVLRAEGADRAGNRSATSKRADGTEMTLRREALPETRRTESGSGKARLFATLRWHGRHGTSITVPFGARAVLRGRLLDADGAGLAGRRLLVTVRPSRGALAETRRLRVETSAHGGFRLELPAGPSRRVAVLFRGDQGLAPARRAPLTLRVRGAVVLHATPSSLANGERLLLWGRVRAQGAPLPRRGKLVAIQYLEEATGRWRPVLVTRSDHAGHFRAGYRFRYVSGRARIKLRAVAIAEERWPYAPGASRASAVSVSG